MMETNNGIGNEGSLFPTSAVGGGHQVGDRLCGATYGTSMKMREDIYISEDDQSSSNEACNH